MRLLGLAFGLFFSLVGFAGYLAFDFMIVNRGIVASGGERMSFGQYAKGWVSFAGMLANDAEPGTDGAVPAMPSELIAMLPVAPEGWTTRPSTPADANPYLAVGLNDQEREIVLSAVTPNPGRGVTQASQAYQNGDNVVVVELVRYPDIVFTSFMATAEKMQLQMMTLALPSRDFMVVRGLEVREAALPDVTSARVFIADVGGQIHLRALAPSTMTDHDLLAFFQTLHVPAMNANVVEKVAGMGEVPVIVLASVIDEETRASLLAEREAERLAAETAAAPAAAQAAGQEAGQEAEIVAASASEGEVPVADEAAVAEGVTVRRGIVQDNAGSTFTTGGAAALGEACRTEGGRKICGGTAGE